MRNFVVLCLVLAFAAANHAYIIKSRIVDGKKAETGQWPFYAFLNIRMTEAGKGTACGGTLISDEWILTAAHCLQDVKKVIAHLGESDLMEPDSQHTVIEINEIDQIHTHPNYSTRSTTDDIGKCIK